MVKINLKKLSTIILTLFLLTNCATPYQPTSFTGGYSDIKLGENIFRVSFIGNGYTNSTKAMDLALLRSAEVALQNNFQYFIIASNASENSYSSYTTPQTTNTNGSINRYGGVNVNSVTSGGSTYLISKPSTTNIIVCFKDKPKSQELVYDAWLIIGSVKSRYGIGKKNYFDRFF